MDNWFLTPSQPWWSYQGDCRHGRGRRKGERDGHTGNYGWIETKRWVDGMESEEIIAGESERETETERQIHRQTDRQRQRLGGGGGLEIIVG